MKRYQLLLVSLGLAGGVFAADRVTKRFFFGRETSSVIGTVLQTTSHHNSGLIANLPVPHLAIVIVTCTVTLCIIWMIIRANSHHHTLRSLSLALILGGALGNLADRLSYGFVFDWILIFNWSIINIADIAIGAGILGALCTLDHHDKIA